MSGADWITIERDRQINQKGFTLDHDRQHIGFALPMHALYLVTYYMRPTDAVKKLDDWKLIEKHRDDRMQLLVVAGALIAAEIDRLQAERAELTNCTVPQPINPS